MAPLPEEVSSSQGMLPPVSRESLVRLLLYILGGATTLVGSWIGSKIRVYHDNREAHLDDIKQKVLTPLNAALAEQYKPFLAHRSPVVVEKWGVKLRNENASVTQLPIEDGPMLFVVVPDIQANTDQALYADAKRKHFRKIINHTESFLNGWRMHATECHAWVSGLAEEILSESKLTPHPVSYGVPYVMHYRLAVFVYRRLMNNVDFALFKRHQNSVYWVLEGFEGAPAAGTEQEVDSVIVLLDKLLEREKSTAKRLLQNADSLQQAFYSICGELNYAIASRRLRKKCDLVPFF